MGKRKNRKLEVMRKPLQGTSNIIRFNWHLYLLSIGLLILIFLLSAYVNEILTLYLDTLFWLIIGSTLISLLISLYIYDFSDLYKFSWLSHLKIRETGIILNINAGFDETSILIKEKFPKADLQVLDFYDPTKHTEVSIKRARRAYPPFPDTQQVKTTALPLEDGSVDTVLVTFSAHEIRNVEERIKFFKELNRILKPDGQVIVTEHLRDVVNFLAYNIGFFHFHSKAVWLETYQSSDLIVHKELKITPFISTFMLMKNGASS